MKKTALVILAVVMIIFCSQMIFAQNKIFGLGVFAGQPSGITAKYWLSAKGSSALEFGLAYSLTVDNYFYFSASFLEHFFGIIPASSGQIPLFLGIGFETALYGDGMGLGIRIPFGVSYIFGKIPLDIYFEVAPVLYLFPSTSYGTEICIGIRYYF